MEDRVKTLIDVVQTIVIVGLIIFGLFQTKNLKKLKTTQPQTIQNASINTAEITDEADETPAFSSFEQANLALQASVSSLLSRLEILETTDTKKTSSNQGSVSYTPVSTTPAFQPQDIFLGSASTTSTSWVDTSQETSIYSAHYPVNVKVYFEAGLSIIGGEAHARLKNKTTGSVVQNSHVSHNNDTVTWKYSPSFSLHQGNNIYVVQLKSTSSEKATLDGARIKITQ